MNSSLAALCTRLDKLEALLDTVALPVMTKSRQAINLKIVPLKLS